jgi:hypothetical protein
MRMLPALMLILPGTLGIKGTLAAQTGLSPQELEASVLPLPEALRADAGLRGLRSPPATAGRAGLGP